MASVVGAAFGGALAATASAGPGIALKSEAIGLGTIYELPMLILNVQRGGPSTGLPTKPEQSDLFQALYGRNGESTIPVLAPQSPSDCFTIVLEAAQIALKLMTPVFILSDGYLANGAEPWLVPDVSLIPEIETSLTDTMDGTFFPYRRDENLSRPWGVPGTPGLEHRVGGLEKAADTGNVSYDPQNHQDMTILRAAKVNNAAQFYPPLEVFGNPSGGSLLIVGWGGTYGAIREAVENTRKEGLDVSHLHLRHLHPLHRDLEDVLSRFNSVLVAELNMGQLKAVLRAEFLIEAVGLNKVQGKPFQVGEIEAEVRRMLEV